MKSIYDTNKHSVYLLQYHLILVIKYRRKVIDDKICNRLFLKLENEEKCNKESETISKLEKEEKCNKEIEMDF